jgi:hypothetical protein
VDSNSGPNQLHDRLCAIEQSLAAGQYRLGQWDGLLRDIRALPQADRAALAEDLSRISRELHRRHHYFTVPFAAAFAVEIALAIIGLSALVLGLRHDSNLLVMAAAAIWAVAFQPLVKVSTGLLLGIGYDYAYLYHLEPRFKTAYGRYLAAPRSSRIIFHLSGMIGSPLGLWLPTLWTNSHLTIAYYACRAFFWLIVATNVGTLMPALAGVRKIGSFRFRDSSAGMAALEIREALEL